jgi:CheY-like chemotaxis protein
MNAELKKILVIDDNSDIRDLIQFIFEKAGRTVFQGENGERDSQ